MTMSMIIKKLIKHKNWNRPPLNLKKIKIPATANVKAFGI